MRVREAGILDNLAQSETQFSELAHLVPVGIAHFDEHGCYTFVNGRLGALTGRSVEELIGKKWSEFVTRTTEGSSPRLGARRLGQSTPSYANTASSARTGK